MRKILTMYADDFIFFNIKTDEYKIKNINPEKLTVDIFEKICDEYFKQKFEVIIINIDLTEKYSSLIKKFVDIARKYKILIAVVLKKENIYKQDFFKLGLFYIAYTKQEKIDMLLSIKNVLDIYKPIKNYNINFTEKEKEIFELLEQNKNNVVKYIDIKRKYLNKYDNYVFTDEMNSIKSLIYKIKKKIEIIDLEIINVRNEGYKLQNK